MVCVLHSDDIDSIQLLKYRQNALLHLNVGPFLVLIASICAVGTLSLQPTIAAIAASVICVLCVICSLVCYWNVHARCLMQFRKVNCVIDASAVLVRPLVPNEPAQIIWLNKDKDNSLIWFVYYKGKYIYDQEKNAFVPQKFPVDYTLSRYLTSTGLSSANDVPKLMENYGPNIMEIQFPPFKELFLDRILAPMFVFQIFSVSLMFLNGYWYYCLLILGLLMVFEVVLVYQQRRNLSRIREMGNRPYLLYVFRDREWYQRYSNQLLPGDLCAITRCVQDEVLPCDLLLLRGTCVVDESMLTGESIPVLKEPIADVEDLSEPFTSEKHEKIHVLHGGTRVLQYSNASKASKVRVPMNGCLAYVIRTGFSTNQGRLLKTMLKSVQSMTVIDKESYLFIAFLMIFAIAAACYVWIHGQDSNNQSRYKLFLSCITIIADVIPPELSLELSNAVNSSLISLSKLGVYCTEPHRIPYAGKVDICCFDKTGTLTSDEIFMEGVAYDSDTIVHPNNISQETADVIAVCHSLMNLDGTLCGDPIEKAALEATNWYISKYDTVLSRVKGRGAWHIEHRNHFTSALGRMSVVATTQSTNTRRILCAVKGAPEYLEGMFAELPENYKDTANKLALRGRRILALGYKEMPSLSAARLKRADLECDLKFGGFMVISCPLKHDTKTTLDMIKNASHSIKMITGDNPLTACHVARQLEICRNNSSLLILSDDRANWVPIGTSVSSLSLENYPYTNDDLCVSGPDLDWLRKNRAEMIDEIITRTLVFARTTPSQKEYIIDSLNRAGFVTLMCGDGTNDVGALKKAGIGVALCSVEEEKNRQRTQKNYDYDNQKLVFDEEMEARIVKLGDASIAAPFTSSFSSIQAVCHIIRQGRCTLVTTLQIYKILALNALILAYGRSVLYLDGVQYSDAQATIEGIFIALSFLAISRAQPVEKLSRERPIPDILNSYTLLTVFVQSLLHLATLVFVSKCASRLLATRTDMKIDLEAEFHPTLLNTVVFATVILLQTCNFAVNYRGRPFMQSLLEHKNLSLCLIGSVMFVLITLSGSVPFISNYLQLIVLPKTLFVRFILCVFGDLLFSFAIDRILYRFLAPIYSRMKDPHRKAKGYDLS